MEKNGILFLAVLLSLSLVCCTGTNTNNQTVSNGSVSFQPVILDYSFEEILGMSDVLVVGTCAKSNAISSPSGFTRYTFSKVRDLIGNCRETAIEVVTSDQYKFRFEVGQTYLLPLTRTYVVDEMHYYLTAYYVDCNLTKNTYSFNGKSIDLPSGQKIEDYAVSCYKKGTHETDVTWMTPAPLRTDYANEWDEFLGESSFILKVRGKEIVDGPEYASAHCLLLEVLKGDREALSFSQKDILYIVTKTDSMKADQEYLVGLVPINDRSNTRTGGCYSVSSAHAIYPVSEDLIRKIQANAQ